MAAKSARCADNEQRIGGREIQAMPEVDPEDLSTHGADLGPSESIRWADAVNTAATMAEAEGLP